MEAGPLDNGSFVSVYVTSLQRHKVSRRYVRPGESSTLALEAIVNNGEDKSICIEKIIRKGMVLLSHCEKNLNSVSSNLSIVDNLFVNCSALSI